MAIEQVPKILEYDINETISKDTRKFHLAGIVPVAGDRLDYNMPWDDCLMPIGANYTAIERAVYECAMARCDTIWVVCDDNTMPLVKRRMGAWIRDPAYTQDSIRGGKKDEDDRIPIFFVPMHPKFRNRSCFGWSALYGSFVADWTCRRVSKWVKPSRYYVAFPYGMVSPEAIRPFRRALRYRDREFYFSYQGKTVKDGEYLSFTFNDYNYRSLKHYISHLNVEKGWKTLGISNFKEYLTIKQVFCHLNAYEGVVMTQELPWYYDISSWDKYRIFMGSEHSGLIKRPEKVIYPRSRWNPIGVDDEEIEKELLEKHKALLAKKGIIEKEEIVFDKIDQKG